MQASVSVTSFTLDSIVMSFKTFFAWQYILIALLKAETNSSTYTCAQYVLEIIIFTKICANAA